MTEKKPASTKRWILIALTVILAGLLIWGISWATYARPPLPEALAALENNELVEVALEPWLTFTPTGDIKAGLIFYPGGRIDPRGYASLMSAIAREGYLVVVPSMPINMAIFDTNAADEIISHFPGIDSWGISGHSVGGVAAAMFTSQNPGLIDGLAIWAAFPAGNSDLSLTDIPIYVIYGEVDPAANRESVQERMELLPADTIYVEIEGGDHHQFGTYLIDPEDHLALTSQQDQQEQIIRATLDMLAEISGLK
jgi:hypothetical protein